MVSAFLSQTNLQNRLGIVDAAVQIGEEVCHFIDVESMIAAMTKHAIDTAVISAIEAQMKLGGAAANLAVAFEGAKTVELPADFHSTWRVMFRDKKAFFWDEEGQSPSFATLIEAMKFIEEWLAEDGNSISLHEAMYVLREMANGGLPAK